MSNTNDKLLEIEHLKQYFSLPGTNKTVHAVHDV